MSEFVSILACGVMRYAVASDPFEIFHVDQHGTAIFFEDGVWFEGNDAHFIFSRGDVSTEVYLVNNFEVLINLVDVSIVVLLVPGLLE